MKKLCIITPSLGKYSETFIKNQIDLLPFEMLIVTTGLGEFADEGGKPLASLGIWGRLWRFLGRKLFQIDFEENQARLLAKHLIRNKVDQVLFQYGTTAKKGFKACLKAKIPYTIHFHGYDAYTSVYGADFYKEVFQNAKNIIVVSQHMKLRLITLGASEEKTHIIPCGANIKVNSKEVVKGNKDKMFQFLAVGRFVEKKAPYLTILAFAKALKFNDKLRLIFIGEGDLLVMCKDLVKSLKLGKNIKFLGSLKHELVQLNFLKSNAFIQHSKTSASGDKEGLPVAIMEALLMKIPVISTKHSGIPDAVIDGVNGFLSDELDIDGMADNILRAVDFDFQFPEMNFLKIENSIIHLKEILNGE